MKHRTIYILAGLVVVWGVLVPLALYTDSVVNRPPCLNYPNATLKLRGFATNGNSNGELYIYASKDGSYFNLSRNPLTLPPENRYYYILLNNTPSFYGDICITNNTP